MQDIEKNKQELESELIELYEKYASSSGKSFNNIKHIWKQQGKLSLVSMLGGIGDFSKIIDTELYYLTNIDLWMFATKYNIPIIFINATYLRENMLLDIEDKINDLFVCVSPDLDDNYYFIQPSGIINNVSPIYRLYEIANNPQISMMILSIQLQSYITRAKNKLTLKEFIEKGGLLKKNKLEKKKIKLKIRN